MVGAIEQRVILPSGTCDRRLMPGAPTIQADPHLIAVAQWRRQTAKKGQFGAIGNVVDAANPRVRGDRGDADKSLQRGTVNLHALAGHLPDITRCIDHARLQ